MPLRTFRKTVCAVFVALVAGAMTGCATISQTPGSAAAAVSDATAAVSDARGSDAAPPMLGEAVAQLAVTLVGTPYRYGGETPQEGFDCSGLVHYAFAQAGLAVPRTSQEQFRVARKISARAAVPGDLVFFQDQEKLSHVGIYLGGGRFVHAPETGRRVEIGALDAPYYQQHLVGVGRLTP